MSDTMRAIVVREPGGPEVLEHREVERPHPGPGEVLVRVVTSGVNRADLLQRMGRYPAPAGAPQDIPGLEFAGTVADVAADVEGLSVGDAVMGIVGGGAYAEYVATAASTVVKVPAGVDLDSAGALPEVFMTAFDALFLQAALGTRETLLVHAVGSGVGTAALQLGARAGARVIGTSRTPGKLERAQALGLDHALVADDTWPDRVQEVTDGRGADVILDLVGGPYLAGNQQVLAPKGRHVVVGVPGGPKAEIDLRLLMGRRASIRGTVLRARSVEEKAELARAFAPHVVPAFETGELVPVVDLVLPAEKAPEAHRHMEENRNFGKILLRW